ncbi:NAD(P)/FAD-dependent oxidoreductase [Dechloromonas sp. ARDL1]|uniref:NAD(P)/FAD-dependent oxidoreductase n=1 Tax=Dechloromonas sp. ARDL1 TaxID=3322121 RepID=UPI003DA745CC
MLRLTELKLPLDHATDALHPAICQRLGIADGDLLDFSIFRRGYDARKKSAISLIYTLDCTLRDEAAVFKRLSGDRNIGPTPDMAYKVVARAPAGLSERPIVIGMGPCGFMAALLLAQMGFRPIVLERGKIVRERTKDTWGLWRKNTLNPESNVQFGEGGAGTFSDGKLYSQIKDPNFYGRKVLEEFVKAGAPEEIIYVSKPHVGTFRLVKMVENIRQNIVDLDGEIRFEAKVDKLLREDGQVVGVELAGGERLMSRHVVLAVGHSARDTFQMLHDCGVYVEAKPFAIGFRVEHPQTLIDHARFGPNAGNEILGAADYKLVHHCKNGRAAYSFCMCPGGQVVAATSEPGRVVTNGMSQYSRAERNANSALVVNIDPEDFPGDFRKNPLLGMDFQRHWESAAFVAGGGDYSAPAQKIGDFLAGRPSKAQGNVEPSYQPGVHWTDLASCVPSYVTEALREAIPAFDRQIKGFAMADAVLTGVETRTSSPIRIKRGPDFQSINTRGLYPAGEGAGYAGGILSAGVDGIKVAEAVALSMLDTAMKTA